MISLMFIELFKRHLINGVYHRKFIIEKQYPMLRIKALLVNISEYRYNLFEFW